MPDRFLPGAKQQLAGMDAGPVSGNLPRVVWHSTENDPATTTPAAVANFLDRRNFAVHLVWNPVSGEIVQTIPADRYGRGLQAFGFPTNRFGNPCIQIETVGFAAHPFTNGPCNGLDRIMDWLRSFGIPDVFPSGVAGNRDRQTWQKAGHFTHAVTPDNIHTDPGQINPKRLFAGGQQPGHPVGQPREYVVEAGDTLFSIASALLGDGSKWHDIYNANQGIIGPNPALIKAGMKLVIP
jgi:nucleoid-associated protein YgaU